MKIRQLAFNNQSKHIRNEQSYDEKYCDCKYYNKCTKSISKCNTECKQYVSYNDYGHSRNIGV